MRASQTLIFQTTSTTDDDDKALVDDSSPNCPAAYAVEAYSVTVASHPASTDAAPATLKGPTTPYIIRGFHDGLKSLSNRRLTFPTSAPVSPVLDTQGPAQVAAQLAHRSSQRLQTIAQSATASSSPMRTRSESKHSRRTAPMGTGMHTSRVKLRSSKSWVHDKVSSDRRRSLRALRTVSMDPHAPLTARGGRQRSISLVEQGVEPQHTTERRRSRVSAMISRCPIACRQPLTAVRRVCYGFQAGLRRYVIDPMDPWKSAWDWVIIMLVLYTAVVVPLEVGFQTMWSASLSVMEVVDHLVTVAFALDIILSLNTAVPGNWGDIVFDRRVICKRYATSTLVVDIVAVIPFELFVAGGSAVAWTRLLKLPRLLRLGRLLQKLEHISALKGVRIVATIGGFLLLAHFMACAWFFLGDQVARCALTAGCIAGGGSAPGLAPEQTWVWHYLDNYPTQNATMTHQYTMSLFFALTTMTTVGYGDITPKNDVERMFNMAFLVLAAIAYAVIFGNVTVQIQEFDKARNRYQTKIEAIQEFFSLHELPKELRNKTHAYVDALWAMSRGLDHDAVLGELPEPIRREIMLSLHQDLVRTVPIFRDCTEEVLKALVVLLRPQVCLYDDMIVEEGEYASGLYFVYKGVVLLETPESSTEQDSEAEQLVDGQTVYFREYLHAGSYFGEAAMAETKRERISPETAIAATLCHLYVLHGEDFDDVVHRFPESRRMVRQSIASSLHNGESCRSIASTAAKEAIPTLNPEDSVEHRQSKSWKVSPSPFALGETSARKPSKTSTRLHMGLNFAMAAARLSKGGKIALNQQSSVLSGDSKRSLTSLGESRRSIPLLSGGSGGAVAPTAVSSASMIHSRHSRQGSGKVQGHTMSFDVDEVLQRASYSVKPPAGDSAAVARSPLILPQRSNAPTMQKSAGPSLFSEHRPRSRSAGASPAAYGGEPVEARVQLLMRSRAASDANPSVSATPVQAGSQHPSVGSAANSLLGHTTTNAASSTASSAKSAAAPASVTRGTESSGPHADGQDVRLHQIEDQLRCILAQMELLRQQPPAHRPDAVAPPDHLGMSRP